MEIRHGISIEFADTEGSEYLVRPPCLTQFDQIEYELKNILLQ